MKFNELFISNDIILNYNKDYFDLIIIGLSQK